jgi:hypothetical protein
VLNATGSKVITGRTSKIASEDTNKFHHHISLRKSIYPAKRKMMKLLCFLPLSDWSVNDMGVRYLCSVELIWFLAYYPG